jgi:hypothetical protein
MAALTDRKPCFPHTSGRGGLTDTWNFSTPGLLLYYFWSAVTAIVLLNVLISLFSSAYSDVSVSPPSK